MKAETIIIFVAFWAAVAVWGFWGWLSAVAVFAAVVCWQLREVR